MKTVFLLYKELCAEYDLKTTHEITGSPEELIVRLARDLGGIKPAAVHTGEGVFCPVGSIRESLQRFSQA